MKYLKGTMVGFAASLIFSLSANALSLTFSNITIPALSNIYTSSIRIKSNTKNKQTLYTIDAKDRLTNDGRVIQARVRNTVSGGVTTAWQNATKGSTINFGTDSREIGEWKIQLKSKKSLPTKAGYWGTWDYQ